MLTCESSYAFIQYIPVQTHEVYVYMYYISSMVWICPHVRIHLHGDTEICIWIYLQVHIHMYIYISMETQRYACIYAYAYEYPDWWQHQRDRPTVCMYSYSVHVRTYVCLQDVRMYDIRMCTLYAYTYTGRTMHLR